MFRSLTLLAMAASFKDLSFGQLVQEVATKELGRQAQQLSQLSGSGTYGWVDVEICSPWWPWPIPWPPRPFDEVFQLPKDYVLPDAGYVMIDMFRSLSLYNLAFRYSHNIMRSDIQKLALEEIYGQMAKLNQSGSLVGWDEGDGICPPWWPFPWPPKGPGGSVVPEPALVLQDLMRSMLSHNIGMRFIDGVAGQQRVGQARQQISVLVKTMSSFDGSIAAWQPGDPICPDWWPFPWPGPRPLPEILDPARMSGDPNPQPSILTTFELFRGSTVYAIASLFEDQGLAVELQSAAINHLQTQVQQL